uniref:Uncharacterized protein n=1 Tax=Noctiluca scintillans TaxID=2966 RepID=A0A7S1AL16_NOCSC|mmetsp:Transcript_50682/g.135055  ORF Transcript_50682/g.135055 Transcript_50682/m.135055 type:complete len:318 (+) Transcript_50682:48-1001(+)
MGGTDLLQDFVVQCLSWCRQAVVRVFHPLSARILRVSRAHLLHQSETDRESTSVKAVRAPISGAELARLLGNHVEDEESYFEQTSTPWEEAHSSPSDLDTEKDFGSPFFKRPSTNVGKVVSPASLTEGCTVDVVPKRYEKGSAVPGQVLLDAIETGDDDALDLIRNCSVEALNFRDGLHKNALLIASTEGRLEVCRALLSNEGFEGTNATNFIGSSALHLAAGNDHADICSDILACPRFLLGINAVNDNGHTAFDFASDFGDGTALEVLRAAGGSTGGRSQPDRRRGCRISHTFQHQVDAQAEHEGVWPNEALHELD